MAKPVNSNNLPSCECIGSFPPNQKLDALYCVLSAIEAGGGGGGSGNVSAAGTLTNNALVIGQGGTSIATITTGTGVLTALGVNVGSAGAFVTFNGALGTPSSGTLSNATVDGTNSVGFRNVPQNSQSAAYTTVLADSGKHILHPTADNNARTFTIDSNANVPYPIGTAITFVNQINTLTIAITADTLVLAGAGTTGSRSLAANGVATALKIASTTWLISGTGLT